MWHQGCRCRSLAKGGVHPVAVKRLRAECNGVLHAHGLSRIEANGSVGNDQVDASQQQFAQVGVQRWGIFANEVAAGGESLMAIGIAGLGADA